MRKFYFINSIGQQIDLQDPAHYYLNNPAGLGAANDNAYTPAADAFFVSTKSTSQQINVTGDLIMPGKTPYADFQALTDWLFSGYDISFGYNPSGGQTYYVDVDVEGLSKTEMRGGFLTCPLSLTGKSPWYTLNPIVQNMTADSSANFMIFDFPMEAYFSLATNSNSLDITPAGHLPSAIKLIAQGPMDNPVITITNKATGAIVGKTDLTGLSIPAGSTLQYSSVPGESIGLPNTGVWVVAADGITKTDTSNYLNLANINFARLPVGQVYTINLQFAGASAGYTVYLYQYRKAV